MRRDDGIRLRHMLDAAHEVIAFAQELIVRPRSHPTRGGVD